MTMRHPLHWVLLCLNAVDADYEFEGLSSVQLQALRGVSARVQRAVFLAERGQAAGLGL